MARPFVAMWMRAAANQLTLTPATDLLNILPVQLEMTAHDAAVVQENGTL